MKTLLIPFSCIFLWFSSLRHWGSDIYCYDERTQHFLIYFYDFFSSLLFVKLLCVSLSLLLTLLNTGEAKIIYHVLAHGQTLYQINFSSHHCWGFEKKANDRKKREKIKNSSCFSVSSAITFKKNEYILLATLNTNERKQRLKNVFLEMIINGNWKGRCLARHVCWCVGDEIYRFEDEKFSCEIFFHLIYWNLQDEELSLRRSFLWKRRLMVF